MLKLRNLHSYIIFTRYNNYKMSNSKSNPNSLRNPEENNNNQYDIQIIPSKQRPIQHSLLEHETYVKIMDVIDAFNLMDEKFQSDWQDLQSLMIKHIQEKLYPDSKTSIGHRLLTNGKFIVCFINVVSRKSKNNFLKLHLFEYFKSKGNIQTDQRIFMNTFKQLSLTSGSKSLKTDQDRVSRQKNNYSNVADDGDKSVQSSNISYYQRVAKTSSNNMKKSYHLKRSQLRSIPKDSKTKVNRTSTKNRKIVRKSLSKRKQQKKRVQEKQKSKEKQEKQQKQKSEENQEEQKSNVLGSCYHYEVNLNPKTDERQIIQKRTSARLRKSESREKIISVRKSKSRKSIKERQKLSQKKSKKRNIDKEDGKQSEYLPSQVENEEVSVDWIKEHLPELNVKNAFLEQTYCALTQQDKQISAILHNLSKQQQESNVSNHEGGKLLSDDEKSQVKERENSIDLDMQVFVQAPSEQQYSHKQISDKKQKKQNQKQSEQRSLVISKVIDPDVNNHGIYALLQLGKWSVIDFGTRFAVTPISHSTMKKKKHIVEDLQKAKDLANVGQGQLAFIQMNSMIMDLIEKAKQERQEQKKE